MKNTRRFTSAHRRPNTPFRALRAIAALSILSGPIYAQIPGLPITRTWDDGGADGLFGNAVNWSADTLPGVNDIANLNNTTGALTVNLGAASYDIGALLFSANSATQHILNNGTIITSSISQTADDPNALDPTALVMTKSAGADVLRVNVSANTLQLQGRVTSGGLSKFGANVLRLGTSGTAFENAINGSITIYGGTLQASAGNVAGVNNPLGGSGNVTIGASGVTLSLTHSNLAAAGAAGTYDFVRDVVANNNSFTLNADRAAGLATSGTSLIGTVTMGNATLTSTIGNGYTAAMDSLNMVAGSTNTRVQINGLLRVDGLVGDANSNLYKRGGTDLEIRGSSEASFSGDIFHAEANLRLQSMGAGINPAGGSDSTIFFANGYGLTAIDGGQTLQLRSDLALDYGSNIAFRPGVTIGRIDVNRVGTTATAQRLTVGDVNLSGQLLRVLGGNTFSLGIDNIIVAAGSAQIFDGVSADSFVTGNLTLGAGATFTKIGGNGLTLSSDNSATIQGTITLRQGNLIGTVAGSLGPNPIEVGDPAMGTDGFQNRVSRLQVNHADAITNATGTDATAKLGGIIDINATPNGDDIYAIQAGGMLQGNATQLGVLTYNVTALLSPDAIILHEQPGAATGTVVGLPANASTFYGIATNANTLPNMGPGTPWKGISTDNTARTVQGVDAVTPAILNVEGGDNDSNTIEVRLNGLNNVNLNLGTTTAGDGEFKWNSVTTQKVTVELTGAQGLNTLGFVKGGRIAFNELNSASGLSTHVDKIIVSGSSLILPIVGTQGGVPIELRNGGSLDIGNVPGNVIDGPVTVKSGGVFFFNDAQTLGGTGAITFENGSILDISGAAPASFFTSATNPLTFPAIGTMTARFAADNVTNLDARIPDTGSTYVVSGGVTAAIIAGTNLSVTTNTQTAGITIENGILTNDGTSRGFTGPITLNNTNLTVAASRATSLGITGGIATTGSVTVGSATAIDGRDKNSNPDRLSGLGLADPYNGSPQVVFVGPFNVGGSVTATSTHLAFAHASTNIGGDLIFNGNALYLDGGGPLSGGTSTKGDLTARLTDLTGLVANRVADKIILGNYARSEMSVTVGSGLQTITQPFVITGNVNPIDKRTFWVDRADAAGTVNAVFTDILLKNNSQFGIDENNVGVRASLKLDGNATLVRNFDDYDLRDVLKGPSAPATVTLTVGEPTFGWDDATEYLVNGSNATLTASLDGTVTSGITLDVIRSTILFEPNAVLDGVVRTQTAPNRGDSFVISRSNGSLVDTTFAGTGQIQLGRSVAANGPEDLDVRGTEVAGGTAPLHRVAVAVVVKNDGSSTNIDGIIRSDRHNDTTVTARTQVDAIIIEPGATLQTVSVNQATLTLPSITVGANGAIDSTNNTSVFIGDVSGGADPIRFTGQARARITGANVTASSVTVVGAGIDIDPGIGNTTTMTAPVSLSGVLSVRTGKLDMGTSVITGAAVVTVPGLRENKTQGAFDLTTPNSSNQIQLGPVMAQLPANAWGENQTVTYTGKINIPDNGTLGDGFGSIAFAKIFDDSARIQIDGTTYLQSTAFNDAVGSGAINLPVGLHDIEIRLGQGVGGAGPVVQDGGAFGIGLGIDLTDPVDNSQNPGVGNVLDLKSFVIPLDNGTGNLFQTTTVKAGINVAADTTLKAGAFTKIGTINMSGANSVIGASSNSDADALIVAAGANSILSGTAGTSFTFGSIDIATGAVLSLTEPPPPSPASPLDFGGEAAGLGDPIGVPEPGTAMLLLGGLATMLGIRHRAK